MWLGIDTGGTFTDFVLFDGRSLRVHKVLSTPQAPEQAILRGIRDLGLALPGLQVVHGTTVATNAVLERKGVRTVYITNRGLRDVLTIGRQARAELYNLQPEPLPPPVPRELCLEVARAPRRRRQSYRRIERSGPGSDPGADRRAAARGRGHQPAVLLSR